MMNVEETPHDAPRDDAAADAAWDAALNAASADQPSSTPVEPAAEAEAANAAPEAIVETPVTGAVTEIASELPEAPIPEPEMPVTVEATESDAASASEALATEPDSIALEPVISVEDVPEVVPEPEGMSEVVADTVSVAAPEAPVEAVDAAAPVTGVTEDGDDDVIITAKKPRRKTAKPKVDGETAAKAPRRTAKKKEKLPDLGDGSGYIAPDEADLVMEEVPWFAVHCYSGQENKVRTNLEQRIETMGMAGKILKVIVPTEDEIEVRDGKRKTVKRQVFPGYVLVQMHMSEESWFVVRNTPGVTRFVGMGNRPQPLSQQEVNVLLGRMEAEAPKIKVNFRAGQKVRITDGPFADFIGVVDKIDTERAKVVALVSFFGRETPVELDFLQVEKT
jgi:transcriptional antiterminator NusG